MEHGGVWEGSIKMMELMNELERLKRISKLEGRERVRREEVKRELASLAIMQETSWRHKYKAFWLKEGDSNSKFVHSLIVFQHC